LAQIKLALYLEFRKARISKADLARKMGIAKQQVDRLFDLQHSSRVEQIELAFNALGKVISISIEDAAA
jgi:antitoxin HicB